MPVGKRRKSSQTEGGNGEKTGTRMTTESNNELVEEGYDTQKSTPGVPSKRPKPRQAVTPAPVASTSAAGEGEEEEDKSEASPKQPTQPVVQTHMSTRSSTRTIKRPRRDTLSPPSSPVKKQAVQEAKTGTPETKTKRPWELWGIADKNTFFDGLYEFGKDFEAIQGLIAQKCKKKGVVPGLIKNKDQVRHFYYRTWHKIAKYAKFPDDVKKQTQELYGLINYGELRKKIGGRLNDKNGLKLIDLIHQGNTCVKVKGKNHRVRTPVCNALKKLNNVEEPKVDDSPKVPEKLYLEIGARTNSAWSQVQELAQNPRIRMTLKPSHRLSAVLTFLEKKWKPQRIRIKESLGSPETPNKELRLFPHKDKEIQAVSVKVAEVQPRPELSFDNYKENLLGSPQTGAKKTNRTTGSDGLGSGNESSQPGLDKVSSPDGQANAHATMHSCGTVTCSFSMESPGFLIDDENAMFPDDLISRCGELQLSPPNNSPVKSEHNRLMTACDVLNKTTNPTAIEDAVITISDSSPKLIVHCDNAVEMPSAVPSTSAESDQISACEKEDNEQDCLVGRIRKGWSSKDCENLTLAELYLMFGESGKLRLEYEFCDIKPSEILLLQRLTNLLRRLVHLATTEFTDFSKSKPNPAVTSSQHQNLCHKCSGAIGGASSGRTGTGKNSTRNHTAAKNTSSPSGANQSAKMKREPSPEGQEAVFRVPAAVLTRNMPQQRPLTGSRLQMDMMDAATADFLLQVSAPVKRFKAPMRKPMIVQRRLLPKTQIQAHRLLPKTQIQAHQLMTMAMVPTSTMAGTAHYLPMGQTAHQQTMLSSSNTSPPVINTGSVLPYPAANRNLAQVTVSSPVIRNPGPSLPVSTLSRSIVTPVTSGIQQSDSQIMSQFEADLAAFMPTHLPATAASSMSSTTSMLHVNTTLPSAMNVTPSPGDVSSLSPARLGTVLQASISPPSISSLLSISLSQSPTDRGNTDKLLELALGQGGNSDTSNVPDGIEDGKGREFVLDPGLRTPIYPPLDSDQISSNSNSMMRSPFKLDLGTDSQWLGGEAGDLSLSSFLADSPMKKSGDIPTTSSMSVPPLNLFSDASRESTITRMDVDSTLQCMLNESSLDYVAKFADIAAQMTASAEQGRGKPDSTSQESAPVQ